MIQTLLLNFVLLNADSERMFGLDSFTVECYLLLQFDLLKINLLVQTVAAVFTLSAFDFVCACAPSPVSDYM